MPSRARRICPRCRRAYTGKRCPTCTERREIAQPRFKYDSAEWRENRAAFLDDNPICCLCGRAAQVPDHYPVSRRDLIARGVANPDAWEHLRPLCKRCHYRETAKHQPGGWNAPRD